MTAMNRFLAVLALILGNQALGINVRRGGESQGSPKDSHSSGDSESSSFLFGFKEFRANHGGLVSSALGAIAPTSGAAEEVFEGYVNEAEKEDDYGFSSKNLHPVSGNTLMCFPGNAQIVTPEGCKELSNVKIGEKVAVSIQKDNMVFEKVSAFLHREPEKKNVSWISLQYRCPKYLSEKNYMVLSPDHLVLLCPKGAPTSSCMFIRAKHAEGLASTHMLSKVYFNGQSYSFELCTVQSSTVLESEEAESGGTYGIYAPVTKTGTIIVDGILASQFASSSKVSPMFDNLVHSGGPYLAKMAKLKQKLLTPKESLTAFFNIFRDNAVNTQTSSNQNVFTRGKQGETESNTGDQPKANTNPTEISSTVISRCNFLKSSPTNRSA